MCKVYSVWVSVVYRRNGIKAATAAAAAGTKPYKGILIIHIIV